MAEADREKESAYQTWEARGYAAYLRDVPQSARTRSESRTQVLLPKPDVAQAPIIPKPRPAEERPPTEIPWRAKGTQGTRLPSSEDAWVKEQGAITAISELAGQTEDVAFRKYCTGQGVWEPRDLLYLGGLEGDTLMLDKHEGYEPSVVVFCCLFLHSYALYPFEPCKDTPPGGKPDPGPYHGIK